LYSTTGSNGCSYGAIGSGCIGNWCSYGVVIGTPSISIDGETTEIDSTSIAVAMASTIFQSLNNSEKDNDIVSFVAISNSRIAMGIIATAIGSTVSVVSLRE
jgi:hypothetical protein